MARSRTSGRRTDYQWSSGGDVENAQDIGVQAAFGGVSLTPTDPSTLTRCRGKVGVHLDAAAVNESAMILCGLLVVPLEFFNVGTAPEIFGDNVDDEVRWLWQGALYVTSGDEVAIVNEGLIASIDIDSKAMRRMKT